MTGLTREIREQWRPSLTSRLWNAVAVGLMLLLGAATASLFAVILGATVVFADGEGDGEFLDLELSSIELSADPLFENDRLEGIRRRQADVKRSSISRSG